jgi:hypothetical protein
MDGKSLRAENDQMFGNESNQMIEICIRRDLPGSANFTGMPNGKNMWHPDSPRNRQMLNIIMESQNEIFGSGTYWVEAREAKDSAESECSDV